MNTYLFYKATSRAHPATQCVALNYEVELWRGGNGSFKPAKAPLLPFAIWWIMSMLGLFNNNFYAVLLIRRGSELLHRSTIIPGYHRFPFMGKLDLQIGDTWTAPAQRGQGLAGLAIEEILRRDTDPTRTYWYIVDGENTPSIRVIEKAGFDKVGQGIRTRPFGLRVFGQFKIVDSSSMRFTFNI